MCQTKRTTTITLEPTDQSPEGVEELAFVINVLLFEGLGDKEINTEEEFIEALKAELARPKEERLREAREIIKDARRRFREMKGRGEPAS